MKEMNVESHAIALRAIADMRINKDTDFKELAALCIAIAKIELNLSN